MGDHIRIRRTPAPDPVKGYVVLDGTGPELIVSAVRPASERTTTAGRLMRLWHEQTGIRMSEPHPQREIRVTGPSVAATYDVLLDGKDNYQVHRDEVAAAIAKFPGLALSGQVMRAFALRAAKHLADAGITQFLDIGCGLPTEDNIHEVAQRVSADSRVMYVDNDPIVYSHGRALLVGDGTDYLEADVRDAEVILAAAAELLDFSRPVGLIISAVLHWTPADPVPLLARYVQALAPGSYLVMCHNTEEGAEDGAVELITRIFNGNWWPRSVDHIEDMFQGLELVEPGLTLIQDWRPGDGDTLVTLPAQLWGAVARVA